jgi:hypothetical protein
MEKELVWSEKGAKNGVRYTYAQYLVRDDGGKMKAGFKHSGDCVCRAISIATQIPYSEVYYGLNLLGERERITKRKRGKSHAGTGIYKQTIRKYMESIGWTWIPTMKIGSGCTTHLRGDELPSGRLVVNVSKHTVAVINGVIHDIYDCSRGGNRCVYGYFIKK